jgi:ABC-type nitrate/sulfonate/bicarbonate transport system permease component
MTSYQPAAGATQADGQILSTGTPATVDSLLAELSPESGLTKLRHRFSPLLQLERLAVIAVVILIWNLAVKEQWVNHIYAATARQTFDQLITLLGEGSFWSNVAVTLREALEGWAIGASCGLIAGLMLGRWLHAHRLFGPFLTFFNAIPKIALAPLFILWFGVGESSKVVTATLAVFFIIQVPTTAAVALLDPDLELVATTMGANELQRFLHVYLPGVLAAVFGALRLGAVISLLTVVFTEFLAAEKGLGQALITSTNNFDIPTAFAIMFVLAALALAINGAIGMLERRFMRWKDASSRTGAVISL